ncbi:MAG: hypothetical protein ACXVHW_03785 [Methanobacterium sp.]
MTKVDIKKRHATILLASSVADFLSTGFLYNPKSAIPNPIKDIRVSI